MTIPVEYARASADFERFTEDARDAHGHSTRHQAYTSVGPCCLCSARGSPSAMR
jgi:hypothetical protein